jgi:hypothetical protein
MCTSREVTLAKHAVLELSSDNGARVDAVLTSGVDPSRLTDVGPSIARADVL